MAKHDFSKLYSRYAEVIAHLPETFDSHEFILELAQQNQAAYVEALYAYRDAVHVGTPAPFQFVHRTLAAKLKDFPELVELVRVDQPSRDIFGNRNECAAWRKVNMQPSLLNRD
jgi:hypothetical protein